MNDTPKPLGSPFANTTELFIYKQGGLVGELTAAQAEALKLQEENAKLQERVRRLEQAGGEVAEILDSATPDVNCSCHINPPCSDCVDHGASREALVYWRHVKDTQ